MQAALQFADVCNNINLVISTNKTKAYTDCGGVTNLSISYEKISWVNYYIIYVSVLLVVKINLRDMKLCWPSENPG